MRSERRSPWQREPPPARSAPACRGAWPLPARAAFRWAPRDPTLFRYNRVEGLSAGARLDAGTDRLAVDASARIGWADLVPNAELGLAHSTVALRLRLGGYYRLAAVDPQARPFGIGNSLGSLLFGRDDGDYYRAFGAEVTGAPALARPQWYGWRVYAERQSPVAKETDASLARLLSAAHRFRDNVVAARADQYGASLTLDGQRGADPARPVLGARLYLEAAAGLPLRGRRAGFCTVPQRIAYSAQPSIT